MDNSYSGIMKKSIELQKSGHPRIEKIFREQNIDRNDKLLVDLGISTAPPDSPSGPARPSKSDFQVYIPSGQDLPDSSNQHVSVMPLPNGDFLATWTMSSLEGVGDQHIVTSRSRDKGLTWTEPAYLDGPETDGFIASWSFPFMVPHTGRIYMFYHKQQGFVDVEAQVTAQLWYRVSDDLGQTWSRAYTHLKIDRNSYSHPDTNADPNFIVYQPPIINAAGEVIVGMTHWACLSMKKDRYIPSEIRFILFNNILTARDPGDLRITILPENGADGLRMPFPDIPEISFLQEPAMQVLSDGRLFCVMRTGTGCIGYSVSKDNGRSWSTPDVLRYVPGGEPLKQPMIPCPLYKLRDGRYVLIFHNNAGEANGGRHIMDWCRNRRPVYLAVGREILKYDKQPLIFGAPRLLADNDRVPISRKQLTEIGTYPSLFEDDGKVYFVYPDRKHYILGKILGEDLLSDFGLPR